MINDKKLDLWASLGLNVLITGEHGVGKTAVVESTFKRQGLKLFNTQNIEDDQKYYLYFSAGTMDPYVDLIGVPREHTKDLDGEKYSYLDLLRPEAFARDCVVGIFMDELNRADAKVRNAVMEIIQFKSINGKKFNNLKMIWAAINPEDEQRTYDVERLDPAQKDRFHIHTSIDYKPDKKYFYEKYGEEKAKAAIQWWDMQGTQQNKEDFRKLCSPRRLDYAIYLHSLGVDLADVLDRRLSIPKLVSSLKNGVAYEHLAKLLDADKMAEAEQFLANDNVYSDIEAWFTGNPESMQYREKIFELLHPERVTRLITAKKKERAFLEPLFKQFYTSEKIASTINTIASTSKDEAVRFLIIQMLPKLESEDIGKAPITFTPTKNSTTVFSTYVENVASNESWMNGKGKTGESDGVSRRTEILKELKNTPRDLSEKDATAVMKICLGVIKHAKPQFIIDNVDSIFGVLNCALQKLKKDLREEQFYKLDLNKMITHNLEKNLWIPTQAS